MSGVVHRQLADIKVAGRASQNQILVVIVAGMLDSTQNQVAEEYVRNPTCISGWRKLTFSVVHHRPIEKVGNEIPGRH